MRKLIFPVAFIGATTAIACSFQAGTGTRPSTTPQGGAAAMPTPQPAGTVSPGRRGVIIGKRGSSPAGTATATATPTSTAAPTSTTAPTTTAAPTSTAPSIPGAPPVVAAQTPFGGANPDPNGWQGLIYWLPAATQKLPADLATLQPSGILFTGFIDVSSRAFTDGFPGVDATRKENFAIRYETPLVVDNEGDYQFRLVSDDGAVFKIDGTLIVDNDGARAQAAEKTGPVHLVKGTHVATVDYFQSTGNVALQLYCKKLTDSADKICPTRL